MLDKWVLEELKTIKNLCEITTILIIQEREDLTATPLEYLFEEAQKILDKNCVERSENVYRTDTEE